VEKEQGEFFSRGERAEVMAGLVFLFGHGDRPGAVVVVGEAVEALVGGFDVQVLLAVRAFPTGEEVGLGSDQLHRVTEAASDSDI
jgi:hypothetical protein